MRQAVRIPGPAYMPILSHVLQRHHVFRQLCARDLHQGGLVALCQRHPPLPRQAPRHVSHKDRPRVDQSCYIHSHNHIYPSNFRSGARIRTLPTHSSVHGHHWHLLFIDRENLPRIVASRIVRNEAGEIGGYGGAILWSLG